MKAVLYDKQSFEWNTKECPCPEIMQNEALLEVRCAGLCGSDIHRINSPEKSQSLFPLGHEICAVVIEAKSQPELIGKMVVVNPIITCGTCLNCTNNKTQFCIRAEYIGKDRAGGFAEYITAPISNLYILPSDMNFKLGVFVDGVAVILHALSNVNINSLNSVLIIGDGTIAALSIAVLKALSPQAQIVIAGKNEKNTSALCNKFSISSLHDLNKDFDLCIETVGRSQSTTINLAIEKAKPTGDILVLGVYTQAYKLDLNARDAFYKELAIKGVNSFICSNTQNDFLDAISLIHKNMKLFSGLITHELALNSFLEGIDVMKSKSRTGAIKVLFIAKEGKNDSEK